MYRQLRLFNDKAKDYVHIYYSDRYKSREEAVDIQRALDWCCAERKIHKLLDVGCGPGLHAREWMSMGFDVTCLDKSEDMISLAQENIGPQGKYICKDIALWDSEDDYDAVISLFSVMSYFLDYRPVHAALMNIYKSLRHGGVFIFDVVNLFHVLQPTFEPEYSFSISEPQGSIKWHRSIDLSKDELICKGEFQIEDQYFKDCHHFKMYTPYALECIIRSVGFKKVSTYCDWHMSDFNVNCPKICVVAIK